MILEVFYAPSYTDGNAGKQVERFPLFKKSKVSKLTLFKKILEYFSMKLLKNAENILSQKISCLKNIHKPFLAKY